MKTIKAQLLPDELQGPGFGWLHLEPFELEAQEPLTFTIERNQDGRFLGLSGQWQPTAQWLAPMNTDAHGDRVACNLGADVIDALLANPQMQYRIVVRSGAKQAQAVLRLAAGLYPSNARAAVIAPAVTEEPAPPEPTPEPEIAPEPPAPAAKRSKMPLLLGLAALAIAGAALWWFMQDKELAADEPVVVEIQEPAPEVVAEPEPEPEPEPKVTVTETVDTGPCALGALAQLQDPLAYLQTCVQSDPSTEQILEIIEAGKAADQCDLIQRLYAHAAQTGHAAVTLAYAQEFDPETFTGGCFNVADAETAVYWYELYLRQEPNDTQALDRIQALKRTP